MSFFRQHPGLGPGLVLAGGCACLAGLARGTLAAMAPGPRALALLALGLSGALAAAFLLLSRRPDPTDLAFRLALGLRRALVRLRPNRREAWYRWGLGAASRDLAVACLEEAARLDHAEAHFELGLLYEEGAMGPGSREKATRHYRAAADLGHPEATYRLAELLRWGIGPARDPGAAHRFYLRSALGGFRPAMEWLVRAFEFGEGVEEDLELAVYWTVKVRETPPAGLRPSHFARKGPPAPADLPPAVPEGRAGETLFRQGMGYLDRDPIAARIWLSRAAEAGHTQAMAELGDLLAGGLGGPVHAAEARAWFQRAAGAGHRGAQIRLGQLESGGPASA